MAPPSSNQTGSGGDVQPTARLGTSPNTSLDGSSSPPTSPQVGANAETTTTGLWTNHNPGRSGPSSLAVNLEFSAGTETTTANAETKTATTGAKTEVPNTSADTKGPMAGTETEAPTVGATAQTVTASATSPPTGFSAPAQHLMDLTEQQLALFVAAAINDARTERRYPTAWALSAIWEGREANPHNLSLLRVGIVAMGCGGPRNDEEKGLFQKFYEVVTALEMEYSRGPVVADGEDYDPWPLIKW